MGVSWSQPRPHTPIPLSATLTSAPTGPLTSALSLQVDVPPHALRPAGGRAEWRVELELDVAHTRARRLLRAAPARPGIQTLAVDTSMWRSALAGLPVEHLCNVAAVHVRLCEPGSVAQTESNGFASTSSPSSSARRKTSDSCAVDRKDVACLGECAVVMDVFYDGPLEAPSEAAALSRRLYGVPLREART